VLLLYLGRYGQPTDASPPRLTANIREWNMVIRSQDEMPPLERYLKDADRLAQEVVNAWGINVQMSNVMTPEFKALLDKACLYRTARRLADNHRKFDVMSEQEEAQEMSLRRSFAEAYRAFFEKHTGAS
jgi:hypothetical protein